MTRKPLKYDPLRDWLRHQKASTLEVSFDEIADMVGGLPPSAEKHDAWWTNETSKSTHVQCPAWLDAGYRASADRSRRKVRFDKGK